MTSSTSVAQPMRIGELSKLSNTPTRSLRYYEEQGLIVPRRLENGYPEYNPYLIDRAIQIRGLIDSGIPTRIIALILPEYGKVYDELLGAGAS